MKAARGDARRGTKNRNEGCRSASKDNMPYNYSITISLWPRGIYIWVQGFVSFTAFQLSLSHTLLKHKRQMIQTDIELSYKVNYIYRSSAHSYKDNYEKLWSSYIQLKTYVLFLDLSLYVLKRLEVRILHMGAKIKTTDLLLWRKVIHNVEELPDLFRCLTLNHVCNGLASDIAAMQNGSVVRQHCVLVMERLNAQEWLDVKIIRSKDDFEQHLLVYCNEFLVPLADVGCPLACFFLARLIRCWKWVIAVMFAIF